MKISPKIFSPIINFLYSIWWRSLRITIENKKVYDDFDDLEPKIAALWHDEMFPILQLGKNKRMAAIVSKSNDGEFVANLINFIGFKTIRGSSSRGGMDALQSISKLMNEEKYICCVTLDGPRGPRHVAKFGAVYLASNIPAKIVPLRIRMKWVIRFKSWDKFQLPLPFSPVCISFGEPYSIQHKKLTKEEIRSESKILAKKMDSLRASDLWKYGKPNKFLLFLLSIITNFLQNLSIKKLYKIADAMAKISWYVLVKRKQYTVNSISKHLNLPIESSKLLAKKTYSENFKSFFEIFAVKKYYEQLEVKNIKTNNPEIMKNFMEENRPIVVATAHIGSWELMEAYAAKLQNNSKTKVVVVRANSAYALDQTMLNLRTDGGITAVEHRSASVVVTEVLRKNGLAAFLVDHNSNKKESIFMPFLGQEAAVNFGPALLALRTKSVVYPVYLLRVNDDYLLHFEQPLDTKILTGTIAERIEQVAKYYTVCAENIVKKYPEQWLWMHKRWKTKA